MLHVSLCADLDGVGGVGSGVPWKIQTFLNSHSKINENSPRTSPPRKQNYPSDSTPPKKFSGPAHEIH